MRIKKIVFEYINRKGKRPSGVGVKYSDSYFFLNCQSIVVSISNATISLFVTH